MHESAFLEMAHPVSSGCDFRVGNHAAVQPHRHFLARKTPNREEYTILALANLRGVRESGAIFAVPTSAFVTSVPYRLAE